MKGEIQMKKVLKKNKKGFTLVELIIVIAILAILAAVAVPSFIGLQNEAVRGKDIGNATAIVSAVNAYNALYPNPDDQITGLSAEEIAKITAKDLWPKGIADTDLARAIARVSFANGVAVADVS